MWTAIRSRLSKWPWLYYGAPLVAWMAFIFLMSAQPALPSAPAPVLDTVFKKLGHMTEYAVLYWLWSRALRTPTALGGVVGAWALAVLYAISDEFHQTFVPNRNGRVADVLIDACGALLVALYFYRQALDGKPASREVTAD
jgi:VanZ family protein